MTFPCVFRFLTKKHKEKTSKVDVFSVSFGLNFEDEGATYKTSVKLNIFHYPETKMACKVVTAHSYKT